MDNIHLNIIQLPHGADLPLPAYESELAAGMDLRAACDLATPIVLQTGERRLVPTGIIIEIPQGFEGQVRPRSGLALKHGITCLNSPGTIDADYRGELKVLLINHGEAAFEIRRGERIAQLIIAPVSQVAIKLTPEVSSSKRGAAGFGSTGV